MTMPAPVHTHVSVYAHVNRDPQSKFLEGEPLIPKDCAFIVPTNAANSVASANSTVLPQP